MPTSKANEQELSTQKHLEKTTRRTLQDWITLLQHRGPQQKKEQEAWLQVKHHLSAPLAKFVVRQYERQNPVLHSAVVNRLFSGEKRFLRPIHDKLLQQIRHWPHLSVRVNSSYISLRNSRQFATLRVTKEGLIVSLKKCPRVHFRGKNICKTVDPLSGAVCYKITLLDESDVSAELIRALQACYKAGAKD
ncbi:MAG: DUF5655 domain-containing protein [Chitinophagales bacterium]|nr:DUF5655 domain-containing protein [Chitinophagales bacterium]MDW8392644.1 DUF5655 domain-containing protein [Chitinophagales bacterium]